MGRRQKKAAFNVEEVVEFFKHLLEEKPLLPYVIPLILLLWIIERWLFSFSNWVTLAIAVWATLQAGLLFCSIDTCILLLFFSLTVHFFFGEIFFNDFEC